MGQIAFDTLQASEELQTAGLTSEQAKAISHVMRKSHEVADVATKRNLEDVRREIAARFDKFNARFEKQEVQMQARFEQLDKRLDFSEKRFDRLEVKFDHLQWFLVVAAFGFLFKEMIMQLFGY